MDKDFELYLKQKELREKYDLHVIVTVEAYRTGINYLVQVFEYEKNAIDCWSDNTTGMYGDNAEFKTYEEALEFGIELANKILEKRKKYGII